jgi:hypothetical protein
MVEVPQPIDGLPEGPQPGSLVPICELETSSREPFQDGPVAAAFRRRKRAEVLD